ncbi:SusF/SusE family outer membrane protein [Prevotella communis]|uniref:pullulanase X25 domain-containing protein n=1 Tax=Prevotella communis TaxID=2913614 RepID=UPI001EDBD0EB|nr:SusF/SusE family outer membrane protein [Prevotella communis]UKK59467.1 SusF/SusE family outer membrane protein [Prevotella communis]
MKTISRYIMTLALLLTAVTGAWAADTYTVAGSNSDMFGAAWDAYAAANDMTKNDDGTYSITYTNVYLDGNVQYKVVKNRDWEEAYPADGDRVITIAEAGTYTLTIHFNPTTHEVYETMPGSEPADVEVTTNAASAQDLFTEAWFTMPPFDATVNYMLVRDMQDETNPVIFSGLPTNDEPIVVKKGDDGKYQPIEALTIQLIDPLAAAEAQNIIAADGITIKVLVGAENGQGAIDYDQENPITLEAFLADMKPGYYWIKAEPTDENSPYDGTVYSSQFTAVEKYDLTVKPANDFSKGKVESVTVGSGSVTIDANTGEATKTGIAPDTEVKIKAKRGYVIEKVEAKKTGPALKTITVNGMQLNYVEGDTWQQAIERPENAGSGWRVQNNYIFNGGYTLFTKGGGGATYVYVRPGDTIDATKDYSLEAD